LTAYTTIPASLPRSEAVQEVLLRQRLQHILRFGLDLYGVKSSPLQLDFYLGEEEEDKDEEDKDEEEEEITGGKAGK
jgi:hypothetical protein